MTGTCVHRTGVGVEVTYVWCMAQWCRAQGYVQCKASIHIGMGLCAGMHRSCVQAVLNLSLSLSVGTRTDPPSLLA